LENQLSLQKSTKPFSSAQIESLEQQPPVSSLCILAAPLLLSSRGQSSRIRELEKPPSLLQLHWFLGRLFRTFSSPVHSIDASMCPTANGSGPELKKSLGAPPSIAVTAPADVIDAGNRSLDHCKCCFWNLALLCRLRSQAFILEGRLSSQSRLQSRHKQTQLPVSY
jgi:hypothetical protein